MPTLWRGTSSEIGADDAVPNTCRRTCDRASSRVSCGRGAGMAALPGAEPGGHPVQVAYGGAIEHVLDHTFDSLLVNHGASLLAGAGPPPAPAFDDSGVAAKPDR